MQTEDNKYLINIKTYINPNNTLDTPLNQGEIVFIILPEELYLIKKFLEVNYFFIYFQLSLEEVLKN